MEKKLVLKPAFPEEHVEDMEIFFWSCGHFVSRQGRKFTLDFKNQNEFQEFKTQFGFDKPDGLMEFQEVKRKKAAMAE